MGLRVRLRKTFSSSITNKKNSTSSQTSLNGEPLFMLRTDIEYYKPNEIPKSKYRGKVDPEHHATLQAFSLFDAFSSDRRRSSLALSGTFSPGGTNSRSAVGSRVNSQAPTRRPSVHEHSGFRKHSEFDGEGSSSNSISREKSGAASTVEDVGTANSMPSAIPFLMNIPMLTLSPLGSLSDQPTAVPSAPTEPNKLPQHDSGIDMAALSKQTTAHDIPFTAEELEKAMTRATLKSNRFSGERRAGVAF